MVEVPAVEPVTVLVTDVVPVTTGLFVIVDRVVEPVTVENVVVVEVDEVVNVEVDEAVVTVTEYVEDCPGPTINCSQALVAGLLFESPL